MALTISTGSWINDSGYAQIFGDNYTDNSLAAPWTVLYSGARELNQRLEIKAANNNATEGAVYIVPVSRVDGDEITLKFYANSSTYTPLIAINNDDSLISWDDASSIVVTHGNAQKYFRVYIAGTKVYEGAGGSTENFTWHDITIRFMVGGGYEVDINGSTVYSGGTDTTETLYFKASAWSATDTYDFYVDDLGYTGYGTFSVHDDGEDYIYNELGQDFSSLDVTHDSATDIGLRYRSGADGISYGAWSAWYTVVAMQALEAESDQYMQLEVRFKGDIGAYISAVTIDGVTDTDPPGPPTSTYSILFATDNYAMSWVEPTDVDYSHCELRRVLDSNTTFLGKNGSGLPEWQASPTIYWKFTNGDTSADWLQPNYVDVCVVGDPVYSVRSGDDHGNFSDWTACEMSTSATDYPIEANVKKGVEYNFSTYTGTLESTDPGIENVESGVAYIIELENKIGTRVDTDPGIANVRTGTTYYIDSVELSGTLVADLPTQGTLTAIDNGNETVTVTISGTDAANESNVYVRNTIHGSWETTAFATITGNSSSIKDLSAGDYELKVITENDSGNQICGATDPVSLHISNPDKSVQYYNVIKVLGNPGEGIKRLILEARTNPINPQTPTE